MRTCPSCPIFLTLALLLSGMSSPVAARVAGWDEVDFKGKPYVTAKSLKAFYRFDAYKADKGHLFFSSPDRVMRTRKGTKDLYINNTKFVLSEFVAFADGEFLISKVDMTKLIDPVLRPRFIRQSAPFHTVILDAGHGGRDTGSRGILGHEKIFALRLAVLVKAELERRQFRVKMTRTGDDDISLPERVAYANRIRDAIFVSLHFNNGPRSANGIETYALPPQGTESTLDGPQKDDNIRLRGNDQDADNIALATAVHASMMHELEVIDRGIRRARWGVLTGINKPAILIEGGYLSSRSEARKIASLTYQKELACAIAEGIVNYRNALRK
ncbi:MAG: N-acetylmuramoyl-L-alanine amidase family protein [Verrucomicrobiales bacterium]